MPETMTLYTSNGTAVALTSLGKEGGEGAIYSCNDRTDQCAKIFHSRRITAELHQKLQVMAENPPNDPMQPRHHSIAWPEELLYRDRGGQDFCGYLMPYLDERFREAHLYYDTQDRVRQFAGSFTWEHLLCAAWNLASAIAALHEKGHCVGDLREKNILIAPDSLITLIDCDSFQILDNQSGTIYFSRVGSPEYLPPQLQRTSFHDQDHDRYYSDLFSLGVLVFRFLMQGFHPFQSRGAAVENAPSTEAKIQLGLYPYELGTDPKYAGRLYPPAYAPPYAAMPSPLRELAKRCFMDGLHNERNRPTAREWYDVLGKESTRCQTCAKSEDHIFSDELAECPWCAISERGLDDPFAKEAPKPAPAPAKQTHLGTQQQLRAATAAPMPPPSSGAPGMEATVGKLIYHGLWASVIVTAISSMFISIVIWVPLMGVCFALAAVFSLMGGGGKFGVQAVCSIILPLLLGLGFNQRPEDKSEGRVQLLPTSGKPKVMDVMDQGSARIRADREQAIVDRQLPRDLTAYVEAASEVYMGMVQERRRLAVQIAKDEFEKSRRANKGILDLQERIRELEPHLVLLWDQAAADFDQQRVTVTNPLVLDAKARQLEVVAFYLYEYLEKELEESVRTGGLQRQETQQKLRRTQRAAEWAAVYVERHSARLKAELETIRRQSGGESEESVLKEEELLLLMNLGVRTLRHHNRPSFQALVPGGTFIWTRSIANDPQNLKIDIAKPVADINGVYLQSQEDSALRAVHAQNGYLLWDIKQEVVRDMQAYLRSAGLLFQDASRVFKVDPRTGRNSWRLPLPSSSDSDRIGIGTRYLVIATNSRSLQIANAADGTGVARISVPKDIIDIHVSEDESRVFVASRATVAAYSLSPQPVMLWERHLFHNTHIPDGSIYRKSLSERAGRLILILNESSKGRHEARIHCLSGSTGEELWPARDGLKPMEEVRVEQTTFGMLIQLDRSIRMMDVTTGNTIWECPFDQAIADLAVGDQIVVVATRRLNCITLAGGQPLWQIEEDGLVHIEEYASLFHPGYVVPEKQLQFPMYMNAHGKKLSRPDITVASRPSIDGKICQPAVINNRVYFYNAREMLYCIWAGDLSNISFNAAATPAAQPAQPAQPAQQTPHAPAPPVHHSVVP